MSWSGHYFLRVKLTTTVLCRGRGSPGLQVALRDFPAGRTDSPIESLADCGNAEMTQAVAACTLECPFPLGASWAALQLLQ